MNIPRAADPLTLTILDESDKFLTSHEYRYLQLYQYSINIYINIHKNQ